MSFADVLSWPARPLATGLKALKAFLFVPEPEKPAAAPKSPGRRRDQLPEGLRQAASEFVAYVATRHLVELGYTPKEIKSVGAGDLPPALKAVGDWIQTLPSSAESQLYKTLLVLIQTIRAGYEHSRRNRAGDADSISPSDAESRFEGHIKHLVGVVLAHKILRRPDREAFTDHSAHRYAIDGAPAFETLHDPSEAVSQLLALQDKHLHAEHLTPIAQLPARGDLLQNMDFTDKVLVKANSQNTITGDQMVTLSQMEHADLQTTWARFEAHIKQYLDSTPQNTRVQPLMQEEVMGHVTEWNRALTIFDILGDNKSALPVKFFIDTRARLGERDFWACIADPERDTTFFKGLYDLVGRGLEENKDLIVVATADKIETMTGSVLVANNGEKLKERLSALRAFLKTFGVTPELLRKLMADPEADLGFSDYVVSNSETALLDSVNKGSGSA